MPTEKKITLYRYDELSERAKERAREWYLSGLYWPHELVHVLEQWKSIAEKLGFAVDDGPWWDLYRRTFEIGRGRFFRDLDDDDLDALEKEWGPNPETGWEGNPDVLSLIAEVRAIRPHMSARIEDGRIYDVEGGQDHLAEPSTDYPGEEWDAYYSRAEEINEEERDKIEESLSQLQHLGLKWLQEEADYIESEEAISEAMAANEWLFFEDGTFAPY